MARKDKILQTFLSHELLVSKYNISSEDQLLTIREAMQSDKPIIKALAIIVDGLQQSPPETDNSLRKQVLQFLNETAI